MSSSDKFVTTLVIVACWVLIAPGVTGQESDSIRTWTNSTGAFKVEAAFEKFEDGKVHLKRKDTGEVITVPLAKLSKDDQAYMRKFLLEQRKSDAASSEAIAGSIEMSDSGSTDEPMIWQGTWNNRKYGTDGPLKCVAKAKDAKSWDAKFDGMGLGKPFNYQVTIETSKKGEKTLLQGTSNVSGDTYRWTGVVEGDIMTGKYRSASGNNGEFRLLAANASKPSN